MFQMSLSISMLLAPIFSGKIVKKIKIGRLIFSSFLFVSILILIMSIIPSKFFYGFIK